MQYNLKNKKVLITGAAGGIGKALCSKFIENDCVLICTSTNTNKLHQLKDDFGSNHFFYKLNLSDNNNMMVFNNGTFNNPQYQRHLIYIQ